MRKAFVGLLLLVTSFYGRTVGFAQTGTVTVSVNIVGNNCDVSLYLQRTGGTAWALGFASFVFNFNSTALSYSGELVEGIWDNNASSFYGDQSSASYAGGLARSVEIDFLGDPGQGIDVPTLPTLLGTLRFTITNFSANHNITWNQGSSAIVDDSGVILNTITFIDPSNGPLPITLSSFTASYIGENRARLDWTTLTELNNLGFNVQKSIAQPNNYQTVPNSFIQGHGTTTDPHNYTFTDENVTSGTWYYRLEQIDMDGTRHYTDGVRLDVVLSTKEIAPIEFALLQNYPNPFNPSTEIKFSVEATGRANVKVFNLIGQEVATLFDGFAEAGQYYRVRLDAANLPSGVYFYRLQNESKSDLRKMILLK